MFCVFQGKCPDCDCSYPHGSNYAGSCCWRFALPEEWAVKPLKDQFYDPDKRIEKCASAYFDPSYTHCNFKKDDFVRTYDEYGWNDLWTVCGK